MSTATSWRSTPPGPSFVAGGNGPLSTRSWNGPLFRREIHVKDAFKRFFESHAGKTVAGVVLADLLFSWPDLLGWAVAGYLLYWSIGHLRQAFRLMDAEDEEPPVPVEAAVRTEDLPGLPDGDPLDMATRLDMAARKAGLPADPDRDLVVTGTASRNGVAGKSRRSA
jgi:hypothetical protein